MIKLVLIAKVRALIKVFMLEALKVGSEHVKNSLSNHSTTQQDGLNDTASRQVLTINGPATVKSADSAPATHEISGNNVSKKWVFRLQNGETPEQSNKTTEIMSTAGLLGPCSQNDHPNVHNSTSSSGKTVTDITKVGTGGTFPSLCRKNYHKLIAMIQKRVMI